ncbi:hypothetical protein D3C80_2169350 [compost metagenome]
MDHRLRIFEQNPLGPVQVHRSLNGGLRKLEQAEPAVLPVEPVCIVDEQLLMGADRMADELHRWFSFLQQSLSF